MMNARNATNKIKSLIMDKNLSMNRIRKNIMILHEGKLVPSKDKELSMNVQFFNFVKQLQEKDIEKDKRKLELEFIRKRINSCIPNELKKSSI